MKPGTVVTKVVVLPDTRPKRYETFENNRETPLPTYKKTGKIMWVFWEHGLAVVRWSDGTRSKEMLKNLEEKI